MRRFIDAQQEVRCKADVTLRDGSLAQCGRRRVVGDLCTQHAKIAGRKSCKFSGGNVFEAKAALARAERPLDAYAVAKASGRMSPMESGRALATLVSTAYAVAMNSEGENALAWAYAKA